MATDLPFGAGRSRSILSRWIPDDLPRAHLVATAITAGVVALCPLPFGSVETYWTHIWTIPLALALPCFTLRRLRKEHLPVVLGAIALTLAVAAVVWIQVTPDPAHVSPNPLWAVAAEALGRPLPATVSVDPALSWSALGRPLLLLLAFLCGFAASLERTGARLLFGATAYAGLAYAIYGLLSHLLDPTSLLGTEKSFYLDDLTGTFVNRNTAATFFGSIMILWWVRAVSELASRVSRASKGLRDWAAAIIDSPPRPLVVAAIGWFLAFGALLLTRSRAGVLLSLGGVALSSIVLLRHRLSARGDVVAALACTVLVGAVVLEIFAGALAARIQSQGLVDQGRLSAYASAVAIIKDHPLLGTGLGTFADVFQQYRSADMATVGVWDRAHNTPLEIGVELGLPIAAAVVVLWAFGLLQFLRGALRRRRDVVIPASALGIGILGSLHALVDFSPQIPGFAVMWVALLGGGIAQSVSSDRPLDTPATFR